MVPSVIRIRARIHACHTSFCHCEPGANPGEEPASPRLVAFALIKADQKPRRASPLTEERGIEVRSSLSSGAAKRGAIRLTPNRDNQ
jgi:hypothetical protein